MAIAGSAMPSMRVRVFCGEVVGDMPMYRHSDALVHDVADAAERLRNGETIFLRTTGPQFVELQKLFREERLQNAGH